MTSLYRRILYKAWLITKKYYYLWPLGFFVAFLGNGGEYQMLLDQIEKIGTSPESLFNFKTLFNGALFQGWDFNIIRGFFLILFFVFVLALILSFIWLVISSIAGFMEGVVLAEKNEKKTLLKLILSGSKNFKAVFGIYFFAKTIIYGLLIFILSPILLTTLARDNESLNVFIIFLNFLIFVPIAIIVSFVARFATAYVVFQGQKMVEALKNGWRLFVANWLISLEMAAILFIINILIGFVFYVFSRILFSVFFMTGIIETMKTPGAFWNIMLAPTIIIALLFLFLGAILATYQTSAWTLLYLRLTEGRKAYSKLVRWAAILPGKIKSNK